MTDKQAQDLLAAAKAMVAAPKTSQPGLFREFLAACNGLDKAIADAEKGVKDEADIVAYLAKKGSDDIVEYLTKKGGN